MLDLLVEYAKSHDILTEPGFAPKVVRWAVICSPSGDYLGVVELGDTTQKRNPGRDFKACPELSQPEMKAGGVTKSHFLVETADVLALMLRGNESAKKVESVRAKHAYFVQLLRDATSAMPELGLFAGLLNDEPTLESIAAELTENRARPSDKVTLATKDTGDVRFAVDADAWHGWWRQFRASLHEAQDRPSKRPIAPAMRCLISGELVEPVATQPKIRGLADVGGLPTGDAYASYKQESFCSYGLKQSANAAMSEEAAAAYRGALNRLLDEHAQRLASAKVVHWFRDRVAETDDPLPWIEDPKGDEELHAQSRARKLLQSIRTGERADLGENRFYALTLSGASGRVVVRDWMEGSFETLVEHIEAWFDDLSIVRRNGGTLAPLPKFLAVIGATVRDLNDAPAPFVSKMWRVAVNREPIPQQALAQALARAKIDIIQDNPAHHARMGLLKAYFARREGGNPHMSPYLNEDHPEAAYQCGRLMAVLADVQHAALGDVGAGIVQRFYAAASSTPALVLGRLTRQSQFHLNKLKPPHARWFDGRIADIWARVKDRVPATLTLEQQSLFALGYYQQMAANRTKQVNKEAEKEESND